MALRKSNKYISIINSYLIDSPQPSSLNYWWNIGSLLGAILMIQILSGIFLSMHYSSNIILAFNSIEHIMRDINYGWLIRYIHANGASIYFILIYLHIGKGLYYGSYTQPKGMVWNIGVIILLLSIIIAFLGYCLVYGQMSHWGATVITNLLSAIPFIGSDIVSFIWGGYSVSNPTIQRFYTLHYLFPFILLLLIIIHLLTLHIHGSNNPLGVSSNMDKLPMHNYYIFKDIITIFIILIIFILFVYYSSNTLGHPDNYIKANSMVTPTSIVPEWYLLPYYAILRSIPSKLWGVILMILSILILLLLPYNNANLIKSNIFKLVSKLFFWLFIFNFILLGILGSNHIEIPYILLSQLSAVYYYIYIIILIPLITLLEITILYISAIFNEEFIYK